MDIRKMLEQIIEILNGMDSKNSDIIALASLIIAILALFVTVIFNVITHRQYIESLAPVLSFELYERDSLLYLSVSNSGNSKAGNMHIQLLSIEGNGNEQLKKDNIYKGVIQLYPKESLNGQIAISGRNMETSIAPIVELSITYKRGNDNKTERYKRTVSYTEKSFAQQKCGAEIKEINDSLKSLKYSANRLTNYIEGRTLFEFDLLNVMPKSSLYSDIKAEINNEERVETTVSVGRNAEGTLE